MQAAAAQFVGTHDFSGALRVRVQRRRPRRHRADNYRLYCCTEAATRLSISVTADGYLYNMVRILAGTLADAGSCASARRRASPPCWKAATAAGPGRRCPQRGCFWRRSSIRNWTMFKRRSVGAGRASTPRGASRSARHGFCMQGRGMPRPAACPQAPALPYTCDTVTEGGPPHEQGGQRTAGAAAAVLAREQRRAPERRVSAAPDRARTPAHRCPQPVRRGDSPPSRNVLSPAVRADRRAAQIPDAALQAAPAAAAHRPSIVIIIVLAAGRSPL